MTEDDSKPGYGACEGRVPRAIVTLIGKIATPPERAVFAAIRAGGPLPGTAIMGRVDAPPATVRAALAELREHGVVVETRDGYALTEAGRALKPVVEAVDDLRRRLDEH